MNSLIVSMLNEFCYPHEWITSGLLSVELLELQWANSLRDAEWQSPWAYRRTHPGAGTEHWRTGAFATAMKNPDVISGRKLPELLRLIELDPDPGMASSVAYNLVASHSVLVDEVALVAAQHPVMGLSADAFEQALVRLECSNLSLQQRRQTTVRTLSQADPTVQIAIMKGRRSIEEDELQAWLSIHGANSAVRKYAKHGMFLKRRSSPGGAINSRPSRP